MTAQRSIIHVGGSPGSGKSRLAKAVTEGLWQERNISAEYISLGDRVRLIGRRVLWSAYQDEIITHLNDPETAFTPFQDELVERVIGDALTEADENGTEVVLLDGFPRYASQVDSFAYLALLSHRQTPGALVTRVDRETALARMLKRGRDHSERALELEHASEKLRLHEENYQFTLHQLGSLATNFTIHEIDTSGPREHTARMGLNATLELLGEPLEQRSA